MTSIKLRQLQYETHFAIHTIMRDAIKRLALIALLWSLITWLDHWRLAAAFAALSLFFEALSALQARYLEEDWHEMTLRFIVARWVICVLSTVNLITPAFILVGHGTTAGLLNGFMWMFGVFVVISNSFALIPFYNWSMMLSSFGAAIGLYWYASQIEIANAPMSEWYVAMAMLGVYFTNTVETLHGQKDTHRALTTARIKADARLKALEALSRQDPLTGLLKRPAFDRELAKFLKQEGKFTETMVLILDLDGFKPINDTYSHEAGDVVLRMIGDRLKNFTRENGLAARLGGDEFALAFRAVSSPQVAARIASAVTAVISEPISYHEKELRVGASIGISMSGEVGKDVRALCSAADQAMYRAKTDPTGHIQLYRSDDFSPRLTLEDKQELLAAMAKREIRPQYQPKVRLETGEICGFEALARWHCPDGTIRMPGEFLPKVNELGMQGDFLMHIAGIVIDDVGSLLAEGLDPGQVSINVPEVALATLSGRADLLALLNSDPAVRHHITLEITEDVFIARSAEIIKASIKEFRQGGTRISLDDFGTGFASFQNLQQLDFDELKIDAVFVAGLLQATRNSILINGFLTMARGLEVSVVAEGVETSDQLEMLRAMGCDIGQGFLFGAAEPFDAMRRRLSDSDLPSRGLLRLA